MKPLLFRGMLGLIVIGLTASAGFCGTETAVGVPGPMITVGSSGPITAFRVHACLGWAIKLRNDSDETYTALYAINDWADLKVVPPHSTVKAGYVLGREIPSFRFAPKE